MAYYFGELGLTQEKMDEFTAEAKQLSKGNPKSYFEVFRQVLKDHGFEPYRLELDFELVSLEEAQLTEILDIYRNMSAEERDEFIAKGRQRINEKANKANQPGRDQKTSHTAAWTKRIRPQRV